MKNPYLNRCEKCGGWMLAGGVHAPHYISRGEQLVLVDCQGNEVKDGGGK